MTSHDKCTKECAKTATPLEQVVDASDSPDPFPSPRKKVKGLARQTKTDYP